MELLTPSISSVSHLSIPASISGATAGSPQSPRSVLFTCFALSLALHVAVFATLPELMRNEKLPARALDVALVRHEPPPLETLRPLPDPPVRKADARKPKADTPEKRPPPEPTILALPESPRATEPAFTVAPPPEPRVQVPEPKPESPAREIAAITIPPNFNAAYLRNPAPRYPLAARRSGEQGTVRLKVLVTRDGVPASVGVEKTSGSGYLDSAALETVKNWRFIPAQQGGQAVESWVVVPVVFRLDQS